MKIECDFCFEDISIIVENEHWFDTEDYKELSIKCPHCQKLVLILYYRPIPSQIISNNPKQSTQEETQ
jgi:hypothetical protein